MDAKLVDAIRLAVSVVTAVNPTPENVSANDMSLADSATNACLVIGVWAAILRDAKLATATSVVRTTTSVTNGPVSADVDRT